MIPKLILNYFQFAKVNEKVAEKNKHYTQFSIEKNNNKQIEHTSDYIRKLQIQNEDILLINDFFNLIVDGRFSHPQRKKGPSRYVTEVCINEKKLLVIDLFTLSIFEKQPNKGNLKAQAFFKILEKFPLKHKTINSIICDENLSLIKKI
ncbi:hypothetical protein M0812_04797 [Anaeramoeba flamelloides]|uniref:Integrase catalytic domain-containing protein n=1 Tax=Anaeramoeba flamelloides TaxID=1746091 RepID=A0AAV8AJC1_9EUKA|nr:hypothetical protein M0812_04797 [Anaeramoeba flamelloides]